MIFTMKNETTPIPAEIKLLKSTRCLEVSYEDGSVFQLSFEFLRVYSPSAEVRGHGPGQEVLQSGKKAVDILEIDPVGNYAIKIVFSDGHDSGIYSWDVIHEFCTHQQKLWQDYLDRIEKAGLSRES